ncbi:MAG: hypothetical protein U1E65_23070 [Myxococcota bacterium]
MKIRKKETAPLPEGLPVPEAKHQQGRSAIIGQAPIGISGTTAPSVVIGAGNLPNDLIGAWKLEHGHRSRLWSGPAANGTKLEELSAHGAPISYLMGDLWRRDVPPATGKWVRAWCAELGVRGDSRLGQRLARMALAPEVQRLQASEMPPKALTRYLLAELLAQGADKAGKLDLRRLRAAFGEQDADKLVRWIGARPAGPPLKQYQNDPFELWVLNPDSRDYQRKVGARSDSLFAHLIDAIIGEEGARRSEHPMPLVGALIENIEARGWKKHPGDFVFDEEHLMSSSITRELADRYTRAGKGYSTAVPMLLYEARHHGQQGKVQHFTNIEELGGDAVFDNWAMRTSEETRNWYDMDIALFEEGLKLGEEKPFHRFQVISSGARALSLFNEFVEQMAENQKVGRDYFPPTSAYRETENWYGFGGYEAFVRSLSGVEHTRDGARKLHALDPKFPIVNAAESPVKLEMAGVLLAWGIVDELTRSLEERNLPVKNVLLTGYGSMGAPIAEILSHLGYQVTVKDVDPQALEAARKAKARGLLVDVIDHVPPGFQTDLVLGAVGMPSLSESELENLRSGAIFASASSSNKEFPFRKSRGWAVDDWPTLDLDQPTQTFRGQTFGAGRPGFEYSNFDWVIRRGEAEHLVLNSEYALDMTKAPYALAPEYIQIVRSVMALASLQARNLPEGTKGLVDLDREGQRFIAEAFMAKVDRGEVVMPSLVEEMLRRAYQKTMRALSPDSAA